MIDLLVSLSMRLNVVVEDQFIERSLQDNKNDAQTALNYGSTEHEALSKDGNANFVFQVADAEELLAGEGLNDLFKHFLLKISDVFALVLEERGEVRVIAPHPLRSPLEEETLDGGEDVGMHVFEVESICAILRDILDVTHYVMLCLTAILKAVEERLHVDKWINGIFSVLLHSVHPYIDVAVDLTNRIFSQLNFFSISRLPLDFSIPLADISIIFN